jgi:A/G-specific adenine glycosylase
MKKNGSRLPFAIRKSSISNQVFRWYARTARVLPWRGERNPYRILISEVMLQQTQVGRVLQKYPQFLKRFPGFATLARAHTSSVIRAWKGMGYNNRSVRLQRLAQILCTEGDGRLPRTIEELQLLPGIGKYTAHALACLAFDQHLPVVDTNIKRVLGRLFPHQAKRMDIWKLAEMTLPGRHAHIWNQALMDLGATICTSLSPACDSCPVAMLCPSAFRIQKQNSALTRTEPLRNGLPNRIYRGRIVDVLRNSPRRKFIPATRLGNQIKDSYSTQDDAWLLRLMKSLEKDGLIVMRYTRAGIAASLPQ